MSRIYNNIIETIGNTPLVKLNRVTAGLPATILPALASKMRAQRQMLTSLGFSLRWVSARACFRGCSGWAADSF